mgnify:CR=1
MVKILIKSALFFVAYLGIFKLIGIGIFWPGLLLAVHMLYGLVYKVYVQKTNPWQPYFWCMT